MMKKKGILGLIIIGGFLCSMTACAPVDWVLEQISDQRSGQMDDEGAGVVEQLKQVNELELYELVNAQKLSLKFDDAEPVEDDQCVQIFMNRDMEMLMETEMLTRLMKVDLIVCEDHLCQIDADDLRFECKAYDGMTEADKVYVSLPEVCEKMGSSYDFDMATFTVTIHTQATNIELPEYFSLRDEGRMTTVRSQGDLGTCWAFAALASIESTLTPEEYLTLSADHMSLNSGFNVDQTSGGDFFMALSYLTAWKGPVYEADDPYGDGYTDTTLTPVKHLQEAMKIPEKDYDQIKRMIMQYGAVQSSFFSDIDYSNENTFSYNAYTASYYYNGVKPANHDAVIVGWDDHYPKSNFNIVPEQDGAFICQNSWGTEFGDGGYFYISYEDTNIGAYNMCYTRVDPADNYDHIYQSDLMGWIGSVGYETEDTWFANVYETEEPQYLDAVAFYATEPQTYYSIYVVPEGASAGVFKDAIYIGSGYLDDVGYYTRDIGRALTVHGRFAVIVRMDSEGTDHPIAIEYASDEVKADVDIDDGEGYLSFDGKTWQSAEELYQCNVCLKAFTSDH